MNKHAAFVNIAGYFVAADPDEGNPILSRWQAGDHAVAVFSTRAKLRSYMAGFPRRWAVARVKKSLGLAKGVKGRGVRLIIDPWSEPTADGQVTTRWWEYHGEMGN